MNNIDIEIARYEQILNDKEEEQRRIRYAIKRLQELRALKKEQETEMAQREKMMKEKAIHNKVDRKYSPVYVKIGSKFVEASKFWITLGRECIGCAYDEQSDTYKFFKVTMDKEQDFCEKYMPR